MVFRDRLVAGYGQQLGLERLRGDRPLRDDLLDEMQVGGLGLRVGRVLGLGAAGLCSGLDQLFFQFAPPQQPVPDARRRQVLTRQGREVRRDRVPIVGVNLIGIHADDCTRKA